MSAAPEHPATESSGSRRRQLLPFAALSASYFAHIGFFNPYLPLWLQEMGLSLLAISVIGSLQSVTRLFAPYAWGALSDHTGERVRLLRYGATAAMLLSLGLWIEGGLWWLSLVLLLMFTHTSSMMPMSEAAMAHLVSRGGAFDARRYGRVRLWGSVGFLVTVFAAGAWFEQHGMQHFPHWTVLTLLAVTLSTWVLPNLREEPVAPQAAPVLVRPILRQRPVQWLFASIFFHVLAHIAVYIFLSLYLDSLGYSKTAIGLMWAVGVLVEIGWFYTQSRWLPALSLGGWLLACGLAMVLRMGLTAGWGDVALLMVLAQALHALTFAAHHTACIALLSHHFPGRLRGRGQALYTIIGYGMTGVCGALLGGLLSSHLGLASVFWAGMGSALLASACAWHVWAKRPGNIC